MARLNDMELAKAFVPDGTLTFADVIKYIETKEDLKPTRRRDLASGLRRVANAIGKTQETCLADAAWLRPQIRKVRPAMIGVSEKTWTTAVSNARSALTVVGIVDRTRGAQLPLSSAWRALWEMARASGDDNIRLPLSRFPGFCSKHGIEPNDVRDETIAAFRRALELSELRRDPEAVAWQTAHAWNRAIERIPGWPQRSLAKSEKHNHYSLPLEAFPQGFQDDLARMDKRLSGSDFSMKGARVEPLAEATIRHRLAQVRRFASALALDGVPIEDLRSLSDLLPLDRIERGVQWMADNRHGGKTSQGLQEMMLGLSMLGRELKIDPAHLAALREYAQRLSGDDTGKPVKRKGMTEKNRRRLRQFRDPAARAAFLNLPARLMEKAANERRPVKAARLAEAALAIAILTIAPMRRKNLAAIEIGRHLDRVGNDRVYLTVPFSEVKNKAPLEFELPPRVADLLDAFLMTHRAHLTDPSCKWLFARVDGAEQVDTTVLAARITRAFDRALGLEMNMHLFRHIAAMFILERDPGAYDVVRRLLGHSELSTTIDAYTGMETLSATRFLAEIVEEDQEPPSRSKKRRRT